MLEIVVRDLSVFRDEPSLNLQMLKSSLNSQKYCYGCLQTFAKTNHCFPACPVHLRMSAGLVTGMHVLHTHVGAAIVTACHHGHGLHMVLLAHPQERCTVRKEATTFSACTNEQTRHAHGPSSTVANLSWNNMGHSVGYVGEMITWADVNVFVHLCRSA